MAQRRERFETAIDKVADEDVALRSRQLRGELLEARQAALHIADHISWHQRFDSLVSMRVDEMHQDPGATMKPVRKAVFPVAGLGTRFLPATKAMPKEMLPIVDKPLIQYAVEEAAAAGITQMIFITGRSKRSIADHFDRAPELEAELAAKGKFELLEVVRNISPETESFVYIRQPEPLGLGHAVLCAEAVVGDEPFAVILADDLIDAEQSVIGQLVDARSARGGGNVVAVEDVPRAETEKIRNRQQRSDRQPHVADVAHRREAGA